MLNTNMEITNWAKIDFSKVEYKPSKEQLDKELKLYIKPITAPIQIEADHPILKGSVETKEVEYHAHTDNYEIQNITWSSDIIGE